MPTPSSRVQVLLVMAHALANLVAVTLRHGAYETRATTDLISLRDQIAEWRPDLLMVDLDHYDEAIEVAHSAAGRELPVIGMTRRRDAALKLRAFERGADDVIQVPFTLDEIIARPYAVMRRTRGITSSFTPRIRLGDQLTVDLREQTVMLDGMKRLELTPIQQTLLYLLAANSGEILTREMLLNSVWGGAFQIESNVVDRHVRELRVKLGDDWRTPKYIETIPGRGYRFRRDPAAADARLAVDEAALVGMVQGAGDLADDVDRLVLAVDLGLGQLVIDGAALDEFHDEIVKAVRLADVDGLHDIVADRV